MAAEHHIPRFALAVGAGRVIFGPMSKWYPDGIYIVTASKDGVTEEWVAATSAKEAIVAVQLHAGAAWQIRLSDRRLTRNQAQSLKLRRDEVRRLGPDPMTMLALGRRGLAQREAHS
jgi:hypothetical protein